MATLSLSVKGMTCQGCVRSVEKALRAVDGVQDVTVSLEKNQATVVFDDKQAGAADFRGAVEDAGYDVQ